jgi:hypothetical protein
MRHRSPPFAALQRFLQQCVQRVAAGTRALAFWASVCLPLGYLLVVTVPSAPPTLFAPLVAAHVGSLVLGHTYVPRPGVGGA